MKAIYVGRDDNGAALARATVERAMSSPVVCVAADLPLSAALRAMVDAGRRHLVVVDAAGRCLGVLADRAVAAAWAFNPASLDTSSVTSALDPEPAVVSQRAPLSRAARMMRTLGVDAVAVVDVDGHPVGIVTGSDLVGLLAR